jgi:hypothetical protein
VPAVVATRLSCSRASSPPSDPILSCLLREHIETLFGIVDHWIPSVGDLFFNEAFNKRLSELRMSLRIVASVVLTCACCCAQTPPA